MAKEIPNRNIYISINGEFKISRGKDIGYGVMHPILPNYNLT
jgi:hypothetical protein